MSGVGVGNSGKVGVGVGYFTSDSATLMGAVNKMRKKVPAVKKHMKESLHSLTLYKSCDATITVHQGKANKIWSFSAPSTHASPLRIMPRNPRNVQSLQYPGFPRSWKIIENPGKINFPGKSCKSHGKLIKIRKSWKNKKII